jgi:hypothetical protein
VLLSRGAEAHVEEEEEGEGWCGGCAKGCEERWRKREHLPVRGRGGGGRREGDVMKAK